MTTKQELMDKVRAVKEAKGLSYQDIVRITEQNGEAISIATVQRVFRKNSNVEEFRYHKTIRPIVRAVLGMDEELEVPAAKPTQEQAEVYYTTIEGLKAVVDFKHEQLAALQRETDYLKGIVADYKSEIRWHRRLITAMGVISVLAIAGAIITALV